MTKERLDNVTVPIKVSEVSFSQYKVQIFIFYNETLYMCILIKNHVVYQTTLNDGNVLHFYFGG